MKKACLILLTFLCCCLARPTLAKTDLSSIPPSLEEISITKASQKIRKKEDFFLFIGRTDNVETQKALKALTYQAPHSSRPVYFLNLKDVDSRKYKAFSKKYSIRSHAYLARFANKQQVAVYHNDWFREYSDLLAFLLQP